MACWHIRGLVTSLVFVTLNAWPDGADPSACWDMTPKHKGGLGREQPSHFFLSLSNKTYIPGVPITVTLKSAPNKSFKGFFIQARVTEPGINLNKAVGTFTPVQGTTRLCDGNIALTHTASLLKTTLSFEWNPPPTLQGQIQFLTTFVESKFSFWIGQRSDVVNEGQVATSTTIKSTTMSTPAASPTTITSPTSSTYSSSASTETVDGSDPSSPVSTRSSLGTRDSQDKDPSTTPSVGDVGGSDTAATSFTCLVVGLMLYLVT